MTRDEAVGLLGETCFDVYLNGVAYWRCVPSAVWRYTIGGYQVIKKWLSYRERALLGARPQAGGGALRHRNGAPDRRARAHAAGVGCEL